MRKSLLVVSLLLLSTAWVLAQTSSSADQSSTPPATSITIQGCLSGSAGNYILSDSASGKSYTLVDKNNKLDSHVGHQVEIGGSLAPAQSAEDKPSAPAKDASEQKPAPDAQQRIDVSSVRMISETCSTK